MLSASCYLWDSDSSLYTYVYIFIVILIIWRAKQNFHGLKFKHKRSCCQRHQKVRQSIRDEASRAGRPSKEETEKPWELLSIMKSQSWLPKEGSVRQLLCADNCCQICNATTLEIQQLLENVSLALLEISQDSTGVEMLSMPNVPFDQDKEHHFKYSRDTSLAPVTPELTQLTEYLPQSTNEVSDQEYWADHTQLPPEFQLEDEHTIPETMAPSGIGNTTILVNNEIIPSNLNPVQENQGQEFLTSQVTFQTLNPEITTLTHPVSVAMVPVAHLQFLSPDVLRLLEQHVKKLVDFQGWSLPRLEESIRQFTPPIYSQPENNQPPSFILNNTSQISIHGLRSLSHQMWCSYMASQPTQTFWVSEWSIMDSEQRKHCQQVSNPIAMDTLTPDLEVLSSLCLLPERQANDSRNNLQKKYNQLFCGLPSLHSESLVATLCDSQSLSKNETTSKTSLKEPNLLKEISFLPLLPQHPSKSVRSSSPPSPHGESSHEHQEAQMCVPFLTLAECKALEWHLLQKQLQLPALSPRSRPSQNHTGCEPCDKAQPPETATPPWTEKSVSVLSREQHLSFPEHGRKLLEFHLQKQLVHLRWGLPQKIQQSIQLLLSSNDQQSLSWSSGVVASVNTPQSGHLETNGADGQFSPTGTEGPIPMPHVFAQTKEILQSHMDSKCTQILQGKVPTCVLSSWKCGIPGELAVVVPLPYIPPDQSLELQAANEPDLHHKVMSSTLTTLDQEQQALPGAVIEHCKKPQELSEEIIKKLETTLRHKYLAFISGLPALYGVALSRVTSPATASQSGITEMMPVPVRIPQEPLTQMVFLEDPCHRCEPGIQDDNKASADTAGEFQPEGQEEQRTGQVPLTSQTHTAVCYLFNTHILAKLNFHLKRKVLEIKFGIPVRARQLRDSNVSDPENKSMQESFESLNYQESREPQKQPIMPESPPVIDSKWVHLKKQLSTELKTEYHNQKQPSSKAIIRDSVQWVSKSSQTIGDITEAQLLYIQVEGDGNNPKLEDPDFQSLDNSKSSALVPTLTEKREEPEKPKAAGDLGEGDAGLGLSSANEKRYPAASQKPEGVLLSRAPQGSWQQRHTLHLDARPHSPQHPPHLEFPEPPPPGVPGGKAHERDMQDSPTKPKLILKAVKIPEHAQPAVPRAQGKPLQAQALQDRVLQRPGRLATPHKSPSPPESNLRNKMKSFLHSINPKVKGKIHGESTISTAEKATKTRKENVEKSLAPAKRSMKKTKPESRRRALKTQSVPSEKSAGPPLSGRASPDSTLGLRARQHGSASVPSLPRHCPRHCPRLAHATQVRNPP